MGSVVKVTFRGGRERGLVAPLSSSSTALLTAPVELYRSTELHVRLCPLFHRLDRLPTHFHYYFQHYSARAACKPAMFENVYGKSPSSESYLFEMLRLLFNFFFFFFLFVLTFLVLLYNLFQTNLKHWKNIKKKLKKLTFF